MISILDKLLSRPDMVFVVPKFKSESVSFIVFQYAIIMRSKGLNVKIVSLKRMELEIPLEMRGGIIDIIRSRMVISSLFVPDILIYTLSKIIPSLRWVPFLHCDIVAGMAGEQKSFRRIRISLWRYVLRRAKCILTPTRYAAARVHSEAEIVVLPHAIDLAIDELFRQLPPAAGTRRIPDEAPSVELCFTATGEARYVFIGRDTPTKRLRSMVKLLKRDESAKLLVIGPPGVSQSYFAGLDAEIRERCYFTGSQVDPFRLLTKGDIVVCPSGREGFGMVPIECIARDITVAAIDEGAFRELYSGSSILFEKVGMIAGKEKNFKRDQKALRSRFVGWPALNERADIIELVFTRIAQRGFNVAN